MTTSQGRWTLMWSCVTMARSHGTLQPSPRAPVWWTSPTSLLTVKNVTWPLVPGPTTAIRYLRTLKWDAWGTCSPHQAPSSLGWHHYGNGQRRPIRLCGKCGVGVPWNAGDQERHHVRLLLWPLPGHHLHRAAAEAVLLLHLQPPPSLLPHLLPGSSGFLPACRLWGEGFPRGDCSSGSHCVPADGGWEHASIRECAAYR